MTPGHAHTFAAIAAAAWLAACGDGEPGQPLASTGPAAEPTQTQAPIAPLPAAPSPRLDQLVLRWNAAANRLPADLPAPFGPTTFAWDGTHFPHPTLKGGSVEAYGAFAQVLLAFLESDGTFDLLASGAFFDAPLRSGVASPQGDGAGWTLKQLVTQFSAADSIGVHDALTRAALRRIASRIEAVAPAPVVPGVPPAAPPPGLADAVARWNAVADRMPVALPPPFGAVTYHWHGEQFPHPTFKGGSAEAYGAFANVLLAFLDGSGTLDLLASNHLLRYKLPSGSAAPMFTFANLAVSFGSPDGLGTHDAATRAALAAISQRIDLILAREEAPSPANAPAQAQGR